jgi:hypothetical protein
MSRSRSYRFAALGAVSVLAASIGQAHHSGVMYERTKQLDLAGTVESFQWVNPHAHIKVNVPADGKTPSMAGSWDVEAAAVNIMTRQGWNKSTFKPGDKIVVVGTPLKDGGKGMYLNYAIDATGKRLYKDVGRTPGPNDPPAPAAATNAAAP